MNHHAPPAAQRGVALVALLVMIVLAVGYGFYRSANLGTGQIQERDKLLLRLARAREALIAYAVNDANRPGRLLCPDLIGDGVSPLLSRDDCDAYGGGLPWKTLGLAENGDDQGGKFRYYLSPLFGGQHDTPALNSETATSLHLDDPANDIAAVIIASRGPLDAKNADGDEYFHNGSSNAPDDNDILVAVSRRELMAAVEQRIANELRSCLEQHATSADNPQHTYPWPAPLSNTIFKGLAQSLFGMVPDTQAGNPEMALKDSITKLTTTKNSLISASTAADQLAAARQLQAQAAYARTLYDRLHLAAADLADKAALSKVAFSALDTTIVAATKNKTAFTAHANALPGAIGTALPSLTAFLDSIENSGFDLFLMELQARNPTLKTRIDTATGSPTTANFNKLISPVNLFKNSLLEYGGTSNPEIENAIAAAYAEATDAAAAVNAARKSPVEPLVQQALAESTSLYNANRLIETTILSHRVNVEADEIGIRAAGVSAALQAARSDSFGTQTLAALVSTLESTHTLVSTIAAGSATLGAARSASLDALDSALSSAQTGSDQARIGTDSESAATQLNALATTVAGNGDNVAFETLKSVASTLNGTRQSAPVNLTAGRALRTPAKTVIYWSDIATSQAGDLARLARKGIASQDDSNTSAYTAARKLLASLDGDKDTIALLEKYLNSPSDETARQAQAALNDTLALLTDLLSIAAKLDSSLETGMAAATVPTIWYGSACAFLQPSTGSSNTWWTANAWKNLFFYQISDRVRPAIGQLTVNGSGNYRAVTIAAGGTLPDTQNRTLREAGSYLENANADNSRNGDARNPTTRFVAEAVSPIFNDRVAY